MTDLRSALVEIVREGAPMTVRQIYYQAVTKGLIDKTEQQYKAIGRLLVLMRRDGTIDYQDIADNTRWMRKPTSYGSIEDALAQTARIYRRQVWADLECRVEVWLEKEALAGVLVDVTAKWDVPLMVTRGYPSLSYLHSAGEAIRASGLETFIYYFGDHDPSGVDIARHVAESLAEFAGDVSVTFTPVAIRKEQIRIFNLPTRPTKSSDSRARDWEGGSVEVDALHPDVLRSLANDVIEYHIPEGHMDTLLAAEASERQALRMFGKRMLEEGLGQ
ncbi:MAG: hypothetical protein JNK49_21635 [Planctomycetes bacterium]|nr:hypothetical protein [Planctomycetota bacterium]